MKQPDAIVVGSGMTGGWAAKELTEAGLHTLLLEGGGPSSSVGSDEVEVALDRDAQPVQSQCYACDGRFRNIFVDDIKHPYTSSGGAEFSWIRSRRLGGRSLAWARTCFRLGPQDFDAGPGGVGIQWPLTYAELAPWYGRVERWIGIAGNDDGLAQIPDSECISSFGLNAAENSLRTSMLRRFGGARQLVISRVATLPVPHGGRPAYVRRAHQTHPIEDAAHFSSLSSTLPAAAGTGRLELRCNSIASRILVDSDGRMARGVEVVDTLTRERYEIHAPLVLLAAGALESTRILLNSADSPRAEAFANSSGCLGRYLMDHLMGLGAVGELPAIRHLAFQSGRPATSYMPRYRNVGKADARFVGGYAMICDAFRPSPSGNAVFAERREVSHGSGHNDWVVRLWGFGECVPRRENRVTLDRQRCDAWGLPTLNIDFSWGDNDLDMARDMALTAAETLDAAGARNVRTLDTIMPPGLAVHEMGTARMGDDPRTSVVNRYGQCHDVPNLFVVDGAVMPTSPCQNPSLTYMALASRAACHAAAALRRGDLRAPARTPRLWLGRDDSDA